MKVVSVNIGERKVIPWKNRIVETGIFKHPVKTPIFLGKTEVKHDVIVDRRYHGGFDKAVYAYGSQHYNYWKNLYPSLDWQYGMFGENITIESLDETQIHVGNVYQLGDAKIEVTKPREPCYKLGIRFNDTSIIKQFWNSTKSGIYFKILTTGSVAVNDELILLEENTENPTIAKVYTSKKPQK